MGGSPLWTEFLANDSSIDCDCITVPARDALNGWLLSLPVTTIFSKMCLDRSRKVSLSPESDGFLSQSILDRLAKVCQATSKDLQNRLSISSNGTDPGMTCDPFNSSGSETSFDDSLTRVPLVADLAALQIENETWDLYWAPVNETLPLRIDACKTPLRSDHNFSPCNHRFASSTISSFDSLEGSQNVRKSNTCRPDHSSPQSLPMLPRTTYSPFPNCTSSIPSTTTSSGPLTTPYLNPKPTKATISQPQHTQHKSWPTRTTSTLPPCSSRSPLRTRAHTTPSTPPPFTPTFPSNLSTCTTLNDQSSRASSPCTPSSPLYMHSAPPSPLPMLGMDFPNETSVWEEDDDDDDEITGIVGSLKSKLHIRGASSPEEKDWIFGVKIRQGKKRTRRGLSEVVRDVFRARKKSGTL